MEFTFDDMFVIGDGHKVCEDYSWSGLINGKYPCVIISDGCSSSNHTDIGSRIVVRSLLHALNRSFDLSSYNKEYEGQPLYNDAPAWREMVAFLLKERMTELQTQMGLDNDSLDATLRMAIIIDNHLILFNFGDGYTIIKNHTTGEVVKEYVKYQSNTPFYLNYERCHLTNHYIATQEDGHPSMVDDSGELITAREHTEDTGWRYYDLRIVEDGVWTVSVMSDGVETFFKGNDNTDTDDVIDGITSFKNFRGEFVQRKLGKYLKSLAKNNVEHYDDISVASIKFEVKSENS